MPLKCRCICGCKLLVSPQSAGKRIKCPKCERRLRVPSDVVEKRQAQLAGREAQAPSAAEPAPPRSRINKPLSSLVELPEPAPPPIQPTLVIERDLPAVGVDESRVLSTIVSPSTSASQPSEPVEVARPPRPPVRPPKLPQTAKTSVAPTLTSPLAAVVEPSAAEPVVTSAKITDKEPAATHHSTESDRQAIKSDRQAIEYYRPDRRLLANARWLAVALTLMALVGLTPAVIDLVEHLLSESSLGLSRWACGLMLIGLLQCAYAIYLAQLPDWSSVWVVTMFLLVISATYAAMFGLTLLTGEQNHIVQLLDLTDRLRGGKATAWCLMMLSLSSLLSYFSSQLGSRWRHAS